MIDFQGAASSWLTEKEVRPASNSSEKRTTYEEDILPDNDVNDSSLQANDVTQTDDIITDSPDTAEEKRESKSLGFWIMCVYMFCAGLLFLHFLSQMIGLMVKLLKNNDRIVDEGVTIVNLSEPGEPCSFFRYVFIHPASYDFDTYEQILEHEKIHARRGHTWDLIFSELMVVVFWFNPFAWIFRREVEKNIEYETDQVLIHNREDVVEAYQLNLVNIASRVQPLTVTTNYNQSMIKERILRMNSKKSNVHSLWKFGFILPIVFFTALVINKPISLNAAVSENPQEKTIDAITISSSDDIEGEQSPDDPSFPDNKGTSQKSKEDNYLSVSPSVKTGKNVSDCDALIDAIMEQDMDKVKKYLSSENADCILKNPEYVTQEIGGMRWMRQEPSTPFLAAARMGNIDIAQLLLDNGAKWDLDKYNEGNALIEATQEGKVDFVKWIVNLGADINGTHPDYGNPLIVAAGSGSAEVVEYLISQGVDVNLKTSNQGTALIAAARNGDAETIDKLIEAGAEVNQHTSNQGTAIIAACNSGRMATVKQLIGHGGDYKYLAPNQGFALLTAAGQGHIDIVEYLIGQGADVNRKSSNQGTPLIVASANGHLDMVKLLIKKGADANMHTSNQGSPLSVATSRGHRDVIEFLSTQVDEIDAMSSGHGSALIAAARNGNNDLVDMLLDKGADVNQQNDGQGSALVAAARNGYEETVLLLLSRGAIINAQTDGNGSALNAAARNGMNKMVRLLLDKGALIDLQNDGQGSALNAAARNGYLSTVKLLLEKGADINLYSQGQGTALSAAVRSGHDDIIEYLLSQGANDNGK